MKIAVKIESHQRWIVGSAFCALGAVIIAACSSQAAAPDITYYKDVKPIIDAKCTTCHQAGGIGPFSLVTANDVIAQKEAIVINTAAHIMPPWPPADGCSEYAGDRSLSDEQIATIGNWNKAGAQIGSESDFVALPASADALSLSRIDHALPMAAPYTAQTRPDDYRCFIIDWPDTTTKYITGLGVTPGTPAIVHHVLAYIVSAQDVPDFQAFDDADPGPGYTCFGGPSGSGGAGGSGGGNGVDQTALIGGWAPGATGSDFPPNTGIKIDPGSKIVVQVHYNTLTTDPVPDVTTVNVKVDDSVAKQAYIIPFADPNWITKQTMLIPAGAPDTMHSYSYDAVATAQYGTGGALSATQPYTAYSAALHMHLHGTHATMGIERASGENECMLTIDQWNFHWQGGYGFTQPKIINPGDKFNLECHWANVTPPLQDINWGEKTTDEMCLGFVYVTQ